MTQVTTQMVVCCWPRRSDNWLRLETAKPLASSSAREPSPRPSSWPNQRPSTNGVGSSQGRGPPATRPGQTLRATRTPGHLSSLTHPLCVTCCPKSPSVAIAGHSQDDPSELPPSPSSPYKPRCTDSRTTSADHQLISS